MRDPAYEPETARMLDLVLDADTLFVDCGANIGWWSAIAARRIGAPGRVIAIEASKSVFVRLTEKDRKEILRYAKAERRKIADWIRGVLLDEIARSVFGDNPRSRAVRAIQAKYQPIVINRSDVNNSIAEPNR